MNQILIEKLRFCLLEQILYWEGLLNALDLLNEDCSGHTSVSVLWHIIVDELISVLLHTKFRLSYYKCMKMFFGYGKYASVTQMLFELGLPRCDTVLFNAKVRFTDSYSRCDNNVVHAFVS